MSRYETIQSKVTEDSKRVQTTTLYPPIPRTEQDIYVITTTGDRLDALAYKYYGSVQYYWVIAQANNIGLGSIAIPAGQQLRIPGNLDRILSDLAELNA
jgi:phage tail protein X